MSSGVIWLGQFRFYDFPTGDSEDKRRFWKNRAENFCLLVKERKKCIPGRSRCIHIYIYMCVCVCEEHLGNMGFPQFLGYVCDLLRSVMVWRETFAFRCTRSWEWVFQIGRQRHEEMMVNLRRTIPKCRLSYLYHDNIYLIIYYALFSLVNPQRICQESVGIASGPSST